MFSQVLVPGVLGLFEPVDLSAEVVDSFLVARGEGCAFVLPVL